MQSTTPPTVRCSMHSPQILFYKKGDRLSALFHPYLCGRNAAEWLIKIRISHPIEERPLEANKRSELGHWEADTVAGKTCMVTLTDRKSRFLLLKKIPKKNAEFVKQGMLELLSALPH